MGYTSMMLYTEDTYEIAGEPYFGYMRGRFTAEELKDLDRYAGLLGIELIPCIQTLAHLGSIFRWPAYRDVHDTADILLCGEEKTYALIEKMGIAFLDRLQFKKENAFLAKDAIRYREKKP